MSKGRSPLWRSIITAAGGMVHTLRHERNARVEGAIGLLAIGAGFWLGISRLEWALILVCILLVLTLEQVNTAIEAAVDLATPQAHPLARIAKDTAAGAVLLAAIGSVAIGILIFLPRLWSLVAPVFS